MAPLQDWLGSFKPESVDEGFGILKGTYKTTIKGLSLNEPNQYEANPHYKLLVEVVEVLDGNGSPGRTLRRNYDKTVDDEVKKMLNELFTAGLSLKTGSVEEMEASMELLTGATMYVRAWGFKRTPDSAEFQSWAPKDEKSVKNLKGKKAPQPF